MPVYVPEELVIVGTAIHLNKSKVTLEEIHKYIKLKRFNIEYNNDFKDYMYCKFNEKDKVFTVDLSKFPQYLYSFLM